MTINLQSVPDAVEAVILFGSRSRGDSDIASDVDVAAFAHAASSLALVKVKYELCQLVPDINFSVYSLVTAEQMAKDGSLFLWHLRCEGRVLFERSGWFRVQLSNLNPYSAEKALRDVGTFETVLRDIRENLEQDDSTLLYENATLYSILRSLGMIVCTIDGCPSFRRLEPIYRLRTLMRDRFVLSETEVGVLMAARHVYARNVGAHVKLDQTQSVLTAEKVAAVTEFVRSYVSEKVQ